MRCKVNIYENFERGKWEAGDDAAFWLQSPAEGKYPFKGRSDIPKAFSEFSSLFLPGRPLHQGRS